MSKGRAEAVAAYKVVEQIKERPVKRLHLLSVSLRVLGAESESFASGARGLSPQGVYKQKNRNKM